MREDLPQGELTQMAEDRLWDETEDAVRNFFEDRKELFATFPEKVGEFAGKHGYEGDKNDLKALSDFLHERVVQMGGTLSPATIKNWLTKSPPNKRSREQVYQLCFALGLSVDETDEFFIKAYWDRPFDVKEPYECVYWFCIKNGLPYGKAVELRGIIEGRTGAGPEAVMESTEQIKEALHEVTDEEELIQYLYRHPGSSAQRNERARKKVLALIEECKDVADQTEEDDRAIDALLGVGSSGAAIHKKKKRVRSDDLLLEAIYGFNQRKVDSEEADDKETGRVYRGCAFSFPAYVKRNFPQVSQLQQIRAGTASYDTIRKALIMLEFYSYYGDERLHTIDEDGQYGDFDTFVAETSRMLVECGFGELYYRNPYDYLFAYCAVDGDPLRRFQDFIEAYWGKK